MSATAAPSRLKSPAAPATIALRGGQVTTGFRSAVFDAANRAGMSVNEYVLRATAAELARQGAAFPGVFYEGDFALGSEAA